MGEARFRRRFVVEEDGWNDEFVNSHPEYRDIDYTTARKTGEKGAFASGWVADEKRTRDVLAGGREESDPAVFIKVFSNREHPETPKNEYELMRALNEVNHVAHAIALGGFYDGTSSDPYPAIVETFVPGDLLLAKGEHHFYESACYRNLAKGSSSNESEAILLLDTAIALATTVAELASSDVEHRDLNTRNIKVARTPRGIEAFALDFGQSSRTSDVVTSTVASPRLAQAVYGAPEMFGGDYHDLRTLPWVDMWPLGALLCLVFSGEEPEVPAQLMVARMDQPTIDELVQHKRRFAESFRESSWGSATLEHLGPVGHELGELVAECLSFEPWCRPTAEDTLERLASCKDKLRAQGDLGFDNLPTEKAPDRDPLIGPFPPQHIEEHRELPTVELEQAIAVLYHGILEFRADDDVDPTHPVIRRGRFDPTHPWWREEEAKQKIVCIRSKAHVKAPRSISGLFEGLPKLVDIEGLRTWDVSGVQNMSALFRNCPSLTRIDALSTWDVSSVQNMANLFAQCSSLANIAALSSWQTSNVHSLSWAFSFCSALSDLSPLSRWDVSQVRSMDYLFFQCGNLKSTDGLECWDMLSVTNMNRMFAGCGSLSNIEALGDWDVGAAKTMEWMFYGCSSLESLDPLGDPLGGWYPGNVRSIHGMFSGCSSLMNTDGLRYWDTRSIEDMGSLFADCSGLATVDLSSWNTGRVKTMGNMFINCTGLADILSLMRWNVSKVEDFHGMFAHCSSLNEAQVLNAWERLVARDADARDMFLDCPASPPLWYQQRLDWQTRAFKGFALQDLAYWPLTQSNFRNTRYLYSSGSLTATVTLSVSDAEKLVEYGCITVAADTGLCTLEAGPSQTIAIARSDRTTSEGTPLPFVVYHPQSDAVAGRMVRRAVRRLSTFKRPNGTSLVLSIDTIEDVIHLKKMYPQAVFVFFSKSMTRTVNLDMKLTDRDFQDILQRDTAVFDTSESQWRWLDDLPTAQSGQPDDAETDKHVSLSFYCDRDDGAGYTNLFDVYAGYDSPLDGSQGLAQLLAEYRRPSEHIELSSDDTAPFVLEDGDTIRLGPLPHDPVVQFHYIR